MNLLCPWANHLFSLGLGFLNYKVGGLDYEFIFSSLIVACFCFEVEKSD